PIQRHPDRLAWTILFFGAGLVLAAPLLSQLTATKVFQVPFLNPFLVRLADTLPGNVNANRMTGAVVVLLPIYAALALRWDWHRQRWPWGLAVLLSGASLFTVFLTQSRGAYVATAAALTFLLVLLWPR